MPPSFIHTAARKPDGYNKAHLQVFGDVVKAWMISQVAGGAEGLEQLVCDESLQLRPKMTVTDLSPRTQVTVYARDLGVAQVQTAYDTSESIEQAAPQ